MMNLDDIICKRSYGLPTLVTDYQLLIAFDYLSNDEESLLQLLEMKIKSDLYYKVLS